jgi:hypothetical protein
MRKIHDHKVNGLNEALEITVSDQPGPGGANHRYDILGRGESWGNAGPRLFGVNLRFQNGPIGKNPDGSTRLEDCNGITNEALLAVLIDRMRGFQGLNIQFPATADRETRENVIKCEAPFACRENACALTHLEEALMWLQKRTRDRVARGCEGKNVA